MRPRYPVAARPHGSPHALSRQHDPPQPHIRIVDGSGTTHSLFRAPTRTSCEAQGIDPYAEPTGGGGGRSGSSSAAVARRRGPSIKAILGLAALLLLIIATVGGILLWQRVAAFNDSVSSAPATSSALWGPLHGDEPVNIALFGYGGTEHKSGNYLADSIQIMSVDPKTNKTTVIPIPRDFWIEGLPQLPDNGKINEAFAIGWQQGGVEEAAARTTEILSEVTGLQIDHWMAIDFAGFHEMIDAVGGIDVNNPRAFRYTWNPWKFEHNIWDARFAQGKDPPGWRTRAGLRPGPVHQRAARVERLRAIDPPAAGAGWAPLQARQAAASAHWDRGCR